MSHRAFKYQLQPTPEQEITFAQWAGAARWVWNWCLDQNKKQYETNKTFVFKYDLKKQLTQIKKQDEFNWLNDVPSQAIQNRAIDFEKALKSVWKSGFGFPTYRKRAIEHHNTLRIDQHIKPNKNHVILPKIGKVKWIKHRNLEGRLKSITIKKENDKWWCICLCEIDDVKPVTSLVESDIVGIDLGIKEFVVTSDAEIIKSEHNYRKHEKKLRRKQRQLSKKQKGSKNREKARRATNKLHNKIKCKRVDFLHKTSNQITNDYLYIAHEDLNIKGMLKNHKLAKSIADQGWRTFIEQLKYKSKRRGGGTIKIDCFAPSTKTCSHCGEKRNISLDTRIYSCNNCGLEIDRDLNAAINIKQWGISVMENTGGTPEIYAYGDITESDVAYDASDLISMK